MTNQNKKESPARKTPKKKYSRKGNYTQSKNSESPVRVIEEKVPAEQIFPQSTSIVPVKEFDRPLVKLEEAIAAWDQYQDLINALIKTKDIVVVPIKDRYGNVTGEQKKAKKVGINKIAKFFGYSTEIIRAYKEETTGPQGGKGFIWRVWARAIARNGQFRVAGAACSSTERRFAHLEHDVYATAETRAKKRAIEELAGMGELELMEEENEEPEKKTYKPKPNQEQGYKHSAVTRPELPATPKQKELINAMIDKLKNDYEIETQLEKPVEELNKGEAANLIQKLLVKGKEAKKNQAERIRKEIPTGEPPYTEEDMPDSNEEVEPREPEDEEIS